MSLAPNETTTHHKQDTGDKLRHIYCHCHLDHGMCGAPRNLPVASLTRANTWAQAPANLCIVCHDLAFQPCTRCGE